VVDDVATVDAANDVATVEDAVADVASAEVSDDSTGNADVSNADVSNADVSNADSADAAPPCKTAPATCPGAPWPQWKLEQKNAAAAGAKTTFGLDAYKGKPTLVIFLAGW
jgi:hypothetical protein